VNSPEYPGIAEDDDETRDDEGNDKQGILRRPPILIFDYCTSLQFLIISKLTWWEIVNMILDLFLLVGSGGRDGESWLTPGTCQRGYLHQETKDPTKGNHEGDPVRPVDSRVN